jgi:hypothetical protein
MNCCVWFGFGGASVLVDCRGHPVSCYTTVGGGVAGARVSSHQKA